MLNVRFIFRADQRRAEQIALKQKDQQEGEEYRRLAEQYALEQVEIDKYRRLMQKDTKNMYDSALEEKGQVRRMEKMLDEVKPMRLKSIVRSRSSSFTFRKKMKNCEFTLTQKRKLHV